MFKTKRGYLEIMSKDFEKMISSYIEDDISSEEKKIFENYINNNPEFLKKVQDISSMINLFNQFPKLEPSSKFLYNLEKVTTKKTKSYLWFTPKLKKSFVLSFAMLALLIIAFNDYNVKKNVIVEKNLNYDSLVKSDADTLKNDHFPIKQVKGKINK